MFTNRKLAALLCICLLLAPASSYAAFNPGAIWRVSTTGADTNGGAFDPSVVSPGTDESTGAGTAVTITLTGTTTGTMSPAISSTTHGPGNFVQIASGAGCTVGTYELKSQSAGTGTFDHAMGSTTNVCVGVMGGQHLTIGTPAALAVTGNNICVKADGTYSVSANITLAPNNAGSNTITIYQGYTTTCGVGGVQGDHGQATIQASAAVTGMFTAASTAGIHAYNFILDCNSQAGTVRGVNLSGSSSDVLLDNMLIKNCATTGISSSASSGNLIVSNSRITASISGCTAGINTTGAQAFTLINSLVDANLCHGVSVSAGTFFCSNSISANNTGTSDGFRTGVNTSTTTVLNGCAGYGNGEYGLDTTASAGSSTLFVRNSYFYGNTTKNVNLAGALQQSLNWDYNAYTSGSTTNLTAGFHDVTLTADPTVDGANRNFALNSTSGGGAALKSVGFPGALQAGGTGYTSIGPLIPQATSSQVGYAFGQ